MSNDRNTIQLGRITQTPESNVLQEAGQALRTALSNIQDELDSRGGQHRSLVALEYSIELTFGLSKSLTLRVKVWPSRLLPGKYRYALSHYACTPMQLKNQPYKPSKDQATSVPEALANAIHDFRWAIEQAIEKKHSFAPAWAVVNDAYANTPDFND